MAPKNCTELIVIGSALDCNKQHFSKIRSKGQIKLVGKSKSGQKSLQSFCLDINNTEFSKRDKSAYFKWI
jgi:hypothetical protein